MKKQELPSERDRQRGDAPFQRKFRYVVCIWVLIFFLIAAIVLIAIGWSKLVRVTDENERLRNGVEKPTTNGTATISGIYYDNTPVFKPGLPTNIPLVAGFCPPPQEGKPNPIIKAGSGKSFFECYNGTYYSFGNLAAFKAYTVEDCVDACEVYNTINNGTKCIAWTMTPDLAKVYDTNYQSTCWLKGNFTGEGPNDLASSGRLCKGGNCKTVFERPEL